MLGLGGYGYWCRGFDNYNYVDFKSVKLLYLYLNIMINDYDVFKLLKIFFEI